jgi:hypothetical protein
MLTTPLIAAPNLASITQIRRDATLISMHLCPSADRRTMPLLLRVVAFAAVLATIGCASPGPPRAPSLGLPEPVRDLSVARTGDTVELHFTAPSRSTDKLPLRDGTITGQFCRQVEHEPCVAVPSSKVSVATTGSKLLVSWTDTLPSNLLAGPPRLLAYRVELFTPAGRSAGPSGPAFTVAGPPPAPIEDLHAEGSRLGILLSWNPSNQPGDVILKREDLASAAHKSPAQPKPSTKTLPAIVWLGASAAPANSSPSTRTLDATALPDTPYRYIAQRRSSVQLGNRTIEIMSSLSDPVIFTLREVYPPPSPTGLTAVGFFSSPPSSDTTSTFAVDLIWQPVDDAGQIAGLAGYNVYREAIDPTIDPRDRLNKTPIPTPAFHDTSADPTARYRYSVTAVDIKGNESPAATVILEPSKH